MVSIVCSFFSLGTLKRILNILGIVRKKFFRIEGLPLIGIVGEQWFWLFWINLNIKARNFWKQSVGKRRIKRLEWFIWLYVIVLKTCYLKIKSFNEIRMLLRTLNFEKLSKNRLPFLQITNEKIKESCSFKQHNPKMQEVLQYLSHLC